MLPLALLALLAWRADAILMLFSTNVTQGDFGDRAQASLLCQTWAECPAPVAFITYSYDDVHALEPNFTQNTMLYSLIDIPLGNNGTYDMWDGVAVGNMIGIATMLGADTNSVHWWAGYDAAGNATGNNCRDWTSNSPDDLGTQWPMGVDVSCDNLFQFPCICDFGARRLGEVKRILRKSKRRLAVRPLLSTAAPTHKPTTHAPTTHAPTHKPTLSPSPMPAAHAVQYALLTQKAQSYEDRANFDVYAGNLLPAGAQQDTTLSNAVAEYALADALFAQAYALANP